MCFEYDMDYVLRRADNGLSDQVAIRIEDLFVRGDPRANLPIFANDLINVPVTVEVNATRLQASQLVSLVQARGGSVVCLADLPPSPSSTATGSGPGRCFAMPASQKGSTSACTPGRS